MFFGAGAAIAGASVLEVAKLQGRFDNRRLRGPVARDAYRAAIERLASDPALAAGAMAHVGQSTHLLSVGGKRFLTDPWFYDPAFGALAHTPACGPEDVGELAGVLVSHDHPDHFDARAFDRLDKRAAVLCDAEPRALAERIRALGFAEVHPLREWDTVTIAGVEITATPAIHDIHEIGFVLRAADRSIYFAGDTATHPSLAEIRERFAPTVAILPVDGTRLAGSKEKWVMDPDDAVAAAKLLGVKAAYPSHADAWFSDPLVRAGLASTIAGAPAIFAAKLAAGLPGIATAAPAPGALLQL